MKPATRKIREINRWKRIKRNGNFQKKNNELINSINREVRAGRHLWMHNYTKTKQSENIEASVQLPNDSGINVSEQLNHTDSEAVEHVSPIINSEAYNLDSEAFESVLLNNNIIDSVASESAFSINDITDSEVSESVERRINDNNIDSETSQSVFSRNGDIHSETSECTTVSLRNWAIKFQIRHNALNELLSIMRKQSPDLPFDARTLVQTPRTTIVSSMDGSNGKSGKYWHYGLKKVLTNVLPGVIHQTQTFSLSVNIDGLPMFRSSSNCFWPILVGIGITDIPPLIVGIYCGKCKNQ